MNSDYIIGTRNPQILYAESRAPERVAYAETDETNDAEDVTASATPETQQPAKTARADNVSPNKPAKMNDDGTQEFSFGDLLDILNPLQHIPIVSDIYRAISGDEITSFAKVAGGAVFGGPIGLITGAIDAMFEDETGKPAAETMVAGLFNSDGSMPSSDGVPTKDRKLETQIAEATPDELEDETLDTQVAEATPDEVEHKTLETQVASATLPPVAIPSVGKTGAKQPFGGVMDVANINKTAPNIADGAGAKMDMASAEKSGAIKAAAPVEHPPIITVDGKKFYSLASARRMGDGVQVAMPLNPGPDVRLKPLSRQAIGVNKAPAVPVAGTSQVAQSIPASRPQIDINTAKALGLAGEQQSVADLESGAPHLSPPGLTPADADLAPGYGASQPVPAALIEDMMRSGLEKYQQGLKNGSLQAAPQMDVRG